MEYNILHITRFAYSAPITESVMEIRMQPRTDERQRCVSFELGLSPSSRFQYRSDHQGNVVHQFNIPGQHTTLEIEARSVVNTIEPTLPFSSSSPESSWAELDNVRFHPEFWEFTMPGDQPASPQGIAELTSEFGVTRTNHPLEIVQNLNTSIYGAFEYDTEATTVDTPIEDSIRDRRGVCQDFSSIMIAILRSQGIPARYVSGYLFHRVDDRSHVAQDSTHAWVEAYIPEIGWVGFDPTNNTPATERHIRVAIGRDYSEVPPTRGVFKGVADSTLSVAVSVSNSANEVSGTTLRTVAKKTLDEHGHTRPYRPYDDQQQ